MLDSVPETRSVLQDAVRRRDVGMGRTVGRMRFTLTAHTVWTPGPWMGTSMGGQAAAAA